MIDTGLLPTWIAYLFLVLGSISCTFVVGIIISNAGMLISEWLRNLKYQHKWKHRFDKQPLAKCYCKDCEDWHKSSFDPNVGKCRPLDRYKGDNWFCRDAKPRKTDPDSQ